MQSDQLSKIFDRAGRILIGRKSSRRIEYAFFPMVAILQPSRDERELSLRG